MFINNISIFIPVVENTDRSVKIICNMLSLIVNIFSKMFMGE